MSHNFVKLGRGVRVTEAPLLDIPCVADRVPLHAINAIKRLPVPAVCKKLIASAVSTLRKPPFLICA